MDRGIPLGRRPGGLGSVTGSGPLVPFLLACLITLLVAPAARALARATGFVAHPRADRIHRIPTPLLGGVACILGTAAGFAVASLIFDRVGPAAVRAFRSAAEAAGAGSGAGPFPFAAVWAGAAAFLCLGLWDDRFPLRAAVKGAFQGIILLAVILLWQPQGLLASLPARALLWIAGMLLLNAWNYIDHADGLFALNALAAAAILAVGSGRLGAGGRTVDLLAAVAGACAGFLFWNRPPARIFLGDAGSLALGFIIVAAAAWCVDQGGAEALPGAIGAHGVVLADFLLVTGARLKRGANIFAGGCEHSGHRLSARIGAGSTLIAFAAANALFGLIALWGGRNHPGTATVVLFLLVLVLPFACARLAPPRPRA